MQRHGDSSMSQVSVILSAHIYICLYLSILMLCAYDRYLSNGALAVTPQPSDGHLGKSVEGPSNLRHLCWLRYMLRVHPDRMTQIMGAIGHIDEILNQTPDLTV